MDNDLLLTVKYNLDRQHSNIAHDSVVLLVTSIMSVVAASLMTFTTFLCFFK
jgi:hypothetical protein